MITKLRSRIDKLTRQLSLYNETHHASQKKATQIKQLTEENERLRGVLISLQQEIVRYTTPELSNRLLRLIEEHAGQQTATRNIEHESKDK